MVEERVTGRRCRAADRAIRAGVVVVSALVLVVVLFEGLAGPPIERPAEGDSWPGDAAIRVEATFPRLTLQYYDGRRLWATEHKDLYTSGNMGRTWQWAGRLCAKKPGWLGAAAHRISTTRTRRLLSDPGGARSMLVLGSGTVLVCYDHQIYRSTDRDGCFEIVHTLRDRPEQKEIFRHWCEDDQGHVYYGEYGLRRETDSRVFRSTDDGRTWSTYYTFARGGEPDGVRHIHAVQFDPYGNRVWVATGDHDDECHIGYFEPDGRFVSVGTGGQIWRAVSLLFTEDHVYWGTDAPQGPCGIWRWSRAGRSAEKVADIDGPVFYSCKLEDDTLVMATEIEGVGSDHASVWLSRDGQTWRSAARLRKYQGRGDADNGTFSFPLGEPLPELLFNVTRLEDIDHMAYRARLVVEDSPWLAQRVAP